MVMGKKRRGHSQSTVMGGSIGLVTQVGYGLRRPAGPKTPAGGLVKREKGERALARGLLGRRNVWARSCDILRAMLRNGICTLH